MKASRKTIGVIVILSFVVALLFWGGLMAGYLPGTGATGTSGAGGVGFEFSGYLILMLVNVGLGTVVALMLFGKTE